MNKININTALNWKVALDLYHLKPGKTVKLPKDTSVNVFIFIPCKPVESPALHSSSPTPFIIECCYGNLSKILQ